MSKIGKKGKIDKKKFLKKFETPSNIGIYRVSQKKVGFAVAAVFPSLLFKYPY